MVRVRAGISYALTEAMDYGHCGLPKEELVQLAIGLLEVPKELAALIHRIPGIRWRVSHKGLILFTDWVSRPFHSSDHTEPHPPCTMIRLSRSGFHPPDARKSRLRSMVAVSPRMAV